MSKPTNGLKRWKVYRHFLKLCEERGIDPLTAGFEAIYDATMDYWENVEKLEAALPASQAEALEKGMAYAEELQFWMTKADLLEEEMEKAYREVGVPAELHEEIKEELEKTRRQVDRARMEAEEWKEKAREAERKAAEAPAVGWPVDWLWDKFSAILRTSAVDPDKYRGEFNTEYGVVREASKEVQQRTMEMLARKILLEAAPAPPEVRPPPEVRVPEAPVPYRVYVEEVRKPNVVTRYSIISGRPFKIDLDLVQRVRETGIAMRGRGEVVYRKPLLGFPEKFYHMTPDERMEKFGYRDIYDALAYQVNEARRSEFKKIKLTLDDLRDLAFTDEDLAEIKRYLERPPWRFS